jgi:hypothetical protein
MNSEKDFAGNEGFITSTKSWVLARAIGTNAFAGSAMPGFEIAANHDAIELSNIV